MIATTSRERAIAVVAVLLPVAFVGWLHWAAASAWLEARELASSGTPVDAVVVAVDAATGPRSDGYTVTYRYEWNRRDAARTYDESERVDRATYEAIRPGDTIAVRIDPDDPSTSAIARNDRAATLLFIVVVVDVLLVLAAAVISRTARGRPAP